MAAVDEAQAKEAAGTLLDPDDLLVVVVGKGDVIEPQIAPTGLRYERIDFKDRDQPRHARQAAQAAGDPRAVGCRRGAAGARAPTPRR